MRRYNQNQLGRKGYSGFPIDKIGKNNKIQQNDFSSNSLTILPTFESPDRVAIGRRDCQKRREEEDELDGKGGGRKEEAIEMEPDRVVAAASSSRSEGRHRASFRPSHLDQDINCHLNFSRLDRRRRIPHRIGQTILNTGSGELSSTTMDQQPHLLSMFFTIDLAPTFV